MRCRQPGAGSSSEAMSPGGQDPPSRAGPGRVEPNRAGPSRAEPSAISARGTRAEPSATLPAAPAELHFPGGAAPRGAAIGRARAGSAWRCGRCRRRGRNMALGAGAARWLPHLPAGGCLPLLLLLLLLLCGQLGGGQKKKEVETFASFAIAPGRGCPVALLPSPESPCPRPPGAPRPASPALRQPLSLPSPERGAGGAGGAGQPLPCSGGDGRRRRRLQGSGSAGTQRRDGGPSALSLPRPGPCAAVVLAMSGSEQRAARAALLR